MARAHGASVVVDRRRVRYVVRQCTGNDGKLVVFSDGAIAGEARLACRKKAKRLPKKGDGWVDCRKKAVVDRRKKVVPSPKYS